MKEKISKVSKTIISLVIALSLTLVALAGLTVAYFTDSKSYTGTLEFGNVKLKVTDGNDVEMTDGGKIPFAFGRENTSQTLMPGDTVTINFKVSLQDSSEPAYYLVSLTDTKGVFASNTYFSDGDKNGLNIYVNDGTKTYLQSDSTQTALTTENMKYVGTLSGTEQHEFTIKAEIDPAYETQGGKTIVSLNIFAIQQANLEKYDENNTDKSAYHILTNKINLAVNGVSLLSVISENYEIMGWQKALADNNVDYSQFKTVSFYKTSEVLSTLTYNEAVTKTNDSLYDANDASKGNIRIYTNGTEELAFVSDYKIQAPESSIGLFAPVSKLLAGDETRAAVTKFNFNNFYTNNVSVVSNMFCQTSIKELDIHGWNLSKVKEVFNLIDETIKGNLTSVDMSGVNLSGAANFGGLFRDCTSLIDLNLSNLNTSSFTSMGGAFYNCSSLTSLDLSNWDTSNVTDVSYMFYNCASLQNLDLSSFDTSKVKDTFDSSHIYTCWMLMFGGTFSNSPTTSTLTIGDKFVIDDSNTFDKASIYTRTGFDTTVTLKRGTTPVD